MAAAWKRILDDMTDEELLAKFEDMKSALVRFKRLLKSKSCTTERPEDDRRKS